MRNRLRDIAPCEDWYVPFACAQQDGRAADLAGDCPAIAAVQPAEHGALIRPL